MVFNVYHDHICNTALEKELLTVRRWDGPFFTDKICLTMLYTESDAIDYVRLLRRYNIKCYRKVQGVFEEINNEV